MQNFIAAGHIYIDISAFSALISVEYSYPVFTCPVPSWMFCVNMVLFGSKLKEPFIKTYIHAYIQHLANYSKIMHMVLLL